MKSASHLLLAVALLFGSSAVVFGGNVRMDYDHSVNFSQYHTYSWGQVKTSDPFYVDRIKQAVNQHLQAKGWRLVPSGGAVTIFATDNVHNQKETQTMYDGLGGGWGGGWGWGGWGWGWRMGARYRRRHDHDDESAGREPGDRYVRQHFEEAAVEMPGHGRSLDKCEQEYETAGWGYRQDVQGFSAEAEQLTVGREAYTAAWRMVEPYITYGTLGITTDRSAVPVLRRGPCSSSARSAQTSSAGTNHPDQPGPTGDSGRSS